MKRLIGGVILALVLSRGALAETSPLGRWITASGNVEVEIAPCEASLCGTVIKVLANRSMANTAKAMAGPPATNGLKIITALSPAGPGRWNGRIFNRENGKTYDCVVKPEGQTLVVRPYIGLPLIGKSQTWSRAAG